MRESTGEAHDRHPDPVMGLGPFPDEEGRHRADRGLDQEHQEDDGERRVGAGDDLGHGDRDGEADGGDQRHDMARIDMGCPRLHDEHDAEEAERDGGELEAGERLAQERSRDERHPDRHGELDGDDLGQGDQGERQEPGILGAVMNDVTDDVEPEIGETPLEAAGIEDDGCQDGESDEAAEEHGHEDRDIMAELAAGDGEGERVEKPSRHPDGGLCGRLLRQARFTPV